ncbi:MAG TPA: hypothetical protein ENK19_08605 [Acidobacteria bacterium]|nr:hypothetical protein [Acidobacteriota bacterium]
MVPSGRLRILDALEGDEHRWTRLRAERLVEKIERSERRLAELEGATDPAARALRANLTEQIRMAEQSLLGIARVEASGGK